MVLTIILLNNHLSFFFVDNIGFKVPREIPENFISFLMISHPRVGFYSTGKNLPYGLFRHIFSFIKGFLNFKEFYR